MNEIELYIAVATGLVSLAGSLFQLYRKTGEARDWLTIARALIAAIEITDDEFKTVWPKLKKLLDPDTVKEVEKIAAGKSVKKKVAGEVINEKLRKRLDDAIKKLGIPKG